MEAHSSEGGKQRSLFCKIALFRWYVSLNVERTFIVKSGSRLNDLTRFCSPHRVNTAVVITIVTPFTQSLTNKGGLIEQVYALFFAEIVTTNIIQLADPVGHLQRHLLAPRAPTQDSMNLKFAGSGWELA